MILHCNARHAPWGARVVHKSRGKSWTRGQLPRWSSRIGLRLPCTKNLELWESEAVINSNIVMERHIPVVCSVRMRFAFDWWIRSTLSMTEFESTMAGLIHWIHFAVDPGVKLFALILLMVTRVHQNLSLKTIALTCLRPPYKTWPQTQDVFSEKTTTPLLKLLIFRYWHAFFIVQSNVSMFKMKRCSGSNARMRGSLPTLPITKRHRNIRIYTLLTYNRQLLKYM